MKNYLPQMDEKKLKRLFEIESDFKAGKLSAEEAHKQVEAEIGKVKAYHIAYVEQTMKEEHADECEREDLHALLNMLRDQMDTSLPEIPADHPISHYLKENKDMDIAIFGHTDNTGSDAINNPLSVKRAQAVESYLKSCGVTSAQIRKVDGQGSTNPVADNSTAEGRKQNRRVEVYMYASQAMINAAENGTLQ